VLLRLFISSSPLHHWMALEVVGFAFKICSFDTFQKLAMPSPFFLFTESQSSHYIMCGHLATTVVVCLCAYLGHCDVLTFILPNAYY